jgi:hypothetical protein
MRVCRGIGAALRPEEVARFDQEHDELLRQIAPDTFTILHQVWLHAYTPIGDADVVQVSSEHVGRLEAICSNVCTGVQWTR